MPTKEKSHIAFCVLDKQMVEATARESKLVAIYCTILLLVGIRMVASPKVLDTVGSRAFTDNHISGFQQNLLLPNALLAE